jgi:hypothetical protein
MLWREKGERCVEQIQAFSGLSEDRIQEMLKQNNGWQDFIFIFLPFLINKHFPLSNDWVKS